jgi:hypothetical protein
MQAATVLGTASSVSTIWTHLRENGYRQPIPAPPRSLERGTILAELRLPQMLIVPGRRR